MNDCSSLIQFDTESLSSDYASQYAAFQYITQDNYEEMKANYSASVPDYFAGSYNEFKAKRNQLRDLFARAGMTSLKQDYFRHVLSPTAAQAFAECVAKSQNHLIAAWIAEVTEDKIAVGIRCGLGGDVSVAYTVGPATPLNTPSKLKANSSETLIFDYDRRKGLLLAINALDEKSGATSSDTIYLPPIRKFVERFERKPLFAESMCAAGCQGNTSGCFIPRDAVFVADPDFYLLPETLTKVGEVQHSTGIRIYDEFPIEETYEGRVRRLIMRHRSADGNDAHTQGSVVISWRVIQERRYLEEIFE